MLVPKAGYPMGNRTRTRTRKLHQTLQILPLFDNTPIKLILINRYK